MKAAVEQTAAQWGTVHVALTCAGIIGASMTLTSKTQLDVKNFKRVMDLNLFGSVYVAKYCSVLMSKNEPLNAKGEKGAIIFVSSIAAEEANKG